MKYTFLIIASLALLSSCSMNKYNAGGQSYESDDAYYAPGDTYISDFALVDDEAQMDQQAPAAQTYGEDEYYTPDTSNRSQTNNYYGDVYQNNWNSPFSDPYSCGLGFGNCYSPLSFGLYPWYSYGYNPYTGWNSGFSFYFGYNSGWGWNNPYFGYNPWNNPWAFNSWGYNGWGYNNWYNPWSPYNWNSPFAYYPYNYYGYGFGNGGWNWAGNDYTNNFVFGPRHPIATGSSVNSAYSRRVFYEDKLQNLGEQQVQTGGTGIQHAEHGQNAAFQPVMTQAEKPDASVEASNTDKPSGLFTQQSASSSYKPVYRKPAESGRPQEGRNPGSGKLPSMNADPRDQMQSGRIPSNTRPVNPSRPDVQRPTAPSVPGVRTPTQAPSKQPSRDVSPRQNPAPSRPKAPDVRPSEKPSAPSRNHSDGGKNFSPPSGGRSGGGGGVKTGPRK